MSAGPIQQLRDAIQYWGADDAERASSYPCDRLVSSPDEILFRSITLQAEPSTVFRWLCQLHVAPYSYDWIDNAGRRSPRYLVPGVEDLAVGQTVMTIFTLTDFERDRHLTVHTDHRLFGDLGVTYQLTRRGAATRLVVKLRARLPRTPVGAVVRRLLPAGDLVMMRKQLRTLAALAEAPAAGPSPPGPGR